MQAIYNKIVSRIGRKNWDKIGASRVSECWNWSGYTNGGYGYGFLNGLKLLLHRETHGAIWGGSDGLDVHHVCKNRSCVNPFHLVALPPEEHSNADKMLSVLSHCKAGHHLSGENLIWEKRENGKIRRRCKKCARSTQRVASAKYYRNKQG